MTTRRHRTRVSVVDKWVAALAVVVISAAVGCENADRAGGPSSVLRRPRPEQIRYVFSEDTPYFIRGCRSGARPDGVIRAGTRCAVIRDTADCKRIWTENGSLRVWVEGGVKEQR